MNTVRRALMIAAMPALVACANSQQKLDAKVNSETEVHTRQDVQVEADYLIRTSDVLTEVQKTALLKLRESTKSQLDELQSESLKLRTTLLREVLSPKYNSKEVAGIKARMKKAEDKKLTVIFNAVDEANKIIGRGKLPAGNKAFDDFFIFDTVRMTH